MLNDNTQYLLSQQKKKIHLHWEIHWDQRGDE